MAFRMQALVEALQEEITRSLETVDRSSTFRADRWDYESGGGGITMVLEDGRVFEKAGVNTSAVYGFLPEKTARLLSTTPAPFFATGVSLVIHPRSPFVPTVHANFRYFALGDDFASPIDEWFGGGADLTPVYPFLADARHFHQVWKDVCDRHAVADYRALKQRCDEYFFLPHRGESRGVGGIFYDYMRGDPEKAFAFSDDAGKHFLDAYLPIVERRRHLSFGENHRRFQMRRRGRYVEFNLLFDRGTRFGIETGGRTESILMSLPPAASWQYDAPVEEGSAEQCALRFFRPHPWLEEPLEDLLPSYEGIADCRTLP